MVFLVMAHTVMSYIGLAYVVMAYMAMARIVMADRVMAARCETCLRRCLCLGDSILATFRGMPTRRSCCGIDASLIGS